MVALKRSEMRIFDDAFDMHSGATKTEDTLIEIS